MSWKMLFGVGALVIAGLHFVGPDSLLVLVPSFLK
jgi:hypothetical protein